MSGIDKYTTHLWHFDEDTKDTVTNSSIVQYMGTSSLDTAIKKFGKASLSLVSGAVGVPTTDFGVDDFTIDFFVNIISGENLFCFGKSDSSSVPLEIGVFAENGTYNLYTRNNKTTNGVIHISSGIFDHIAVVRKTSNVYLFVNGKLSVKQTIENNYNFLPSSNGFDGIGGYTMYQTERMTAHFDEFRISKGIARWTSDFTPPTSPYSRELKLYIDSNNAVWGMKA